MLRTVSRLLPAVVCATAGLMLWSTPAVAANGCGDYGGDCGDPVLPIW